MRMCERWYTQQRMFLEVRGVYVCATERVCLCARACMHMIMY